MEKIRSFFKRCATRFFYPAEPPKLHFDIRKNSFLAIFEVYSLITLLALAMNSPDKLQQNKLTVGIFALWCILAIALVIVKRKNFSWLFEILIPLQLLFSFRKFSDSPFYVGLSIVLLCVLLINSYQLLKVKLHPQN